MYILQFKKILFFCQKLKLQKKNAENCMEMLLHKCDSLYRFLAGYFSVTLNYTFTYVGLGKY